MSFTWRVLYRRLNYNILITLICSVAKNRSSTETDNTHNNHCYSSRRFNPFDRDGCYSYTLV